MLEEPFLFSKFSKRWCPGDSSALFEFPFPAFLFFYLFRKSSITSTRCIGESPKALHFCTRSSISVLFGVTSRTQAITLLVLLVAASMYAAIPQEMQLPSPEGCGSPTTSYATFVGCRSLFVIVFSVYASPRGELFLCIIFFSQIKHKHGNSNLIQGCVPSTRTEHQHRRLSALMFFILWKSNGSHNCVVVGNPFSVSLRGANSVSFNRIC